MTAQGDHFSHSGKATVSLCEPVGRDERVGEAHGEHKGHSTAGSRGGNKPTFNANFRRSVEKQVHCLFPQRANHLVATHIGRSIRNAQANNLNFGAKFKHLACKSGACYQTGHRNGVLDIGSCSYFVLPVKPALEHSGAQS